MAFFGFSDISFDKGPPSRKGPLGDLVKSDFEQTTLRYPLDIGNYDKGHYMVFYVRQQEKTSFQRGTVDDDVINSGSGVASGGLAMNDALGDLQSSVSGALSGVTNKLTSGANQIGGSLGLGAIGDKISGALDKVSSGLPSFSSPFGRSGLNIGSSVTSQAVYENKLKAVSGNRMIKTTKLTTDAIALYMPDTLQYTHSQGYDQLSLGTELGGQALAAGKSALEAYEKGGGAEALESLRKTATEGAKQLAIQGIAGALGSGQTGQAIIASTGRVINPMLEMVYKSPAFRTFQFDFTFYPRDEREALEVQQILQRFRFHQAPEILKGASGFLVPPSEFDIRFYYGGNLNPNIPGISTCVLTTIDINYAPNGFSAYEVPGENGPELGRTGMPVAIQLTLQFQEMSYLTKSDFDSADPESKLTGRDPNNIP